MHWAYLFGIRYLPTFFFNFSVVIENAVATAFYANHSLDGAMDAGWSENAEYCFLQKSE